MEDLPGIFGAAVPYLERYGYLAIALVLLIDNMGVPLPGEAVLATGAVLASTGQLDVATVAVVAFVAAALGGNGGYAIGRFGGHPLVVRLGRRIGITRARLDRTEVFFERRGVPVVLLGRFVPIVRQLYALVAGTYEMPWWRFLAANVVGALLWVSIWTTVGYNAAGLLDEVDIALRAGGAVVLVVAVVYLMRRRSRRRRLRQATVSPTTIGAR